MEVKPGLAEWYSGEIVFEQILSEYEDKARKEKNRQIFNI